MSLEWLKDIHRNIFQRGRMGDIPSGLKTGRGSGSLKSFKSHLSRWHAKDISFRIAPLVFINQVVWDDIKISISITGSRKSERLLKARNYGHFPIGNMLLRLWNRLSGFGPPFSIFFDIFCRCCYEIVDFLYAKWISDWSVWVSFNKWGWRFCLFFDGACYDNL